VVAVVGAANDDALASIAGFIKIRYFLAFLISVIGIVLFVFARRAIITARLEAENEERKEMVEALQKSESRFRDFGDSIADYYWEMDENLRFSYFSDRFLEITGIQPEALLGKTRLETGVPDVTFEEWENHLAALDAYQPFRNFKHSRVWLMERKSGSR